MRFVQAFVTLLPMFIPAAAACFASARASRSSKEEWALMAWVPPMPLIGLTIYLVVVLLRDPTAANLWPFVMAGFVLLTGLLFGAFFLARRFLETDDSYATRWKRRERR